MRRLLACIVAVTAGGCSCFDGAYSDYCAATGRCDPQGLELKAESSVRAGACRSFTALLLDAADGGSASFALASPVDVTFYSFPENVIDVYETSGCDGQPSTRITTQFTVMNLSFITRYSGRAGLSMKIDGVDPVTADIVSEGRLRFAQQSYLVTDTQCGGGTTIKLESVTEEGMPLAAALGIDSIPLLLPPGLTGGDDAGCTTQPVLEFEPGKTTAEIKLNGTFTGAGAGEISVSSSVNPVFLDPQPTAWVASTCAPPGGQNMPACCAGTIDMGGMCCLGAGSRCFVNNDCCSSSCSSNRTCQ